MGKLIDILKLQGVLPIMHDGRKGSMLDQSGHNLPLTVGAGTGNKWEETDRGTGFAGTATTEYSAGIQASLDLTTATLFYVVVPHTGNFSPLALMVSKFDGTATLLNGYGAYINGASISLTLGDGVGFQAFSVASLPYIGTPIMVAHSWDGTNIRSWVNGNQVDLRAQTRVPTSVGKTYRLGWPASTVGVHDAAILQAGMISRIITGAEASQMYTEFLAEGWVKSLARKGFRYQYPAKRASEYVAEGIFFDTPEKRRADGLVADYTGNYPGTFVGAPVPANGSLFDGSGISYNGVADWCNHQNMSQINGNTTFTLDGWVEWPAGNIAASSWWVYNNAGAGVFFVVGNGGAASTSTGLYLILGAGSAQTVESALRAGTRQYLAMTFNNGVVKFYVDGDLKTTNVTAALPAAFPNFAASPMRIGTVCKFTPHSTRMRTPLLTDAQVRAEYLKTGAQHLTLRETLEDVSITLAASVAAPGQIGPWALYGDSWACVESAAGRRSMKHIGVGHGAASRPSTDAFGTWHGFMRPGAVSVQECYCFIIASQPGPYNAATPPDGYMLYLNAGVPYFFRRNAGASTILITGPAGSIVVDTEYEFCITRRPADCLFKLWMRGGAWGTIWTLIGQAVEALHQTSKYITLGSVLRSDSFPMYDPRDERYALHHWEGQLNPVDRELPFP